VEEREVQRWVNVVARLAQDVGPRGSAPPRPTSLVPPDALLADAMGAQAES
jgi:hypothetical protein